MVPFSSLLDLFFVMFTMSWHHMTLAEQEDPDVADGNNKKEQPVGEKYSKPEVEGEC